MDLKVFLTTEQLAADLQCSATDVVGMADSGILPVFRVATGLLFDRDKSRAAFAQRRVFEIHGVNHLEIQT